MSQKNVGTTIKTAYLDALKERVLVFDGAMGTTLQTMNLTEDDFGGKHLVGCNDCLVLTSPATIEKVHASFLEAGADVIETDTFRANRLTLADYGLQERTLELNIAAARLARRTADRFSTPKSRVLWRVPLVLPASLSPPTTLKCPISATTRWQKYSASKRRA
jgi:Methionine synthase I (cobalamin-dependent), methyltransferase domain